MTGCGAGEGPEREFFYIGTFDTRGSEGLYVYEFFRDDEQFVHVQTVTDRPGPNFQAIHPDGGVLYSVSGDAYSSEIEEGTVSAYRIDETTGELELINEQPIGDRGPAHVSVDPNGDYLFISNYGPGSLTMLSIESDGSVGDLLDHVQHEGSGAHEERQRGPHMHSAIPSDDGQFLYASDLGIDRIHIYEINRSEHRLDAAISPYVESEPAAGPRHFTIHPGGEFAYSVEELSFTVAAYSRDRETGALTPIQREILVPDGTDTSGYMSAADIHTSMDGRHLYVSTRGADIITIYDIDQESGQLSVIDHISTGGEHPRNFGIDQLSDYLFVANRDTDNVVFFHRDEATGQIESAGLEIAVPAAICVTQYLTER